MSVYHKMAKYYDMLYGKKENILEECNFLEKIFKKYCKNQPLEIADLGCGTGNHSLVLADRNYRVIGIDQSQYMIKEAKQKSDPKKENLQFFVQNMKNIEIGKKVDCAICLFNSFGYLIDQKELKQFFSNIQRSLKDDSILILEFWNIGGIKPSPYKNWTKRQENSRVLYRIEKTNFQIETNILDSEKEFIIIDNDKLLDNFKERHLLKCYTIFELKQLLEKNQFQLIDVLDFDRKNRDQFKKPDRTTLRVIAIAKILK